MCLNADKLLPNINASVASAKLLLFILDEIGGRHDIQSPLHAQCHSGARNIRKDVVLDHDIGEDG